MTHTTFTDTEIRAGDTVLVTWPGSPLQIQGIVQRLPAHPADGWGMVGEHGEVMVVQSYGIMRVLRRGTVEVTP